MTPWHGGSQPSASFFPFAFPLTRSDSGARQAEDGNIRLDHSLTIVLPHLSDSLERALIKSQRSLERLCDSLSSSIVLIGYAAAAYLVVGGLSRLVESTRTRRIDRRPDGDT